MNLLSTPEERSYALFKSHLTEDQLYEWETKRRIKIISQTGETYYITDVGSEAWYFAWQMIIGQHAMRRFCAFPERNLPKGDMLLSIMIALQTRESMYRTKACSCPVQTVLYPTLHDI